MSSCSLVPHEQLSASVIIPARNEADYLPAALNALRQQVDLDGSPLRPEQYEVIVLINNSTDDTFGAAEQFRLAHPRMRLLLIHREFSPEEAYIGHIRRILMNEASSRLRFVGCPWGLVLSTDADTEVAPDWIAQNHEEVEHGAEAVGGRILLPSSQLSQLDERAREIQLMDEQYRVLVSWLEDQCDPAVHDPWPRHHQHFGASFAVTQSAYERVGGLPPEKNLEDVAFHRLLIRHDIRFRHSPAVRVHTSPRLQGRVEVGLSEQLARWATSGKSSREISVPSVSFLRKLFRLRKAFRLLWTEDAGNCIQFASASRIPEGKIRAALSIGTFGAAFEALHLAETIGPDDQSLHSAVKELQRAFTSATQSSEEVRFGTSPLGSLRGTASSGN